MFGKASRLACVVAWSAIDLSEWKVTLATLALVDDEGSAVVSACVACCNEEHPGVVLDAAQLEFKSMFTESVFGVPTSALIAQQESAGVETESGLGE